MTEFLKDKKTLTALILVLGFAFLIRIIHLNLLPIFADEAIYIRWAQIMRVEQNLRFLPLSDGKQPLFMWLTIPFLKVFSDPLLAGRFLSVLSGMGTLVGIFFLAENLLNSKKSAILASFLYAVSPYSFFFDRMALVDSLLSFFGIWTFFFVLQTLKTLRLDFAMISGFLLGGALLTKSPGLFFVILLPSLVLLSDWNHRGKNIKCLIKIVTLFVVIYTIGYGLYSILRLGPNFHLIASRNADYVFPISHLLLSPFNPLVGHLKDALNWLIYLGPFPLLLLLPFGLINLFKENKKVLLILVALTCFPLIVQSEFAKVFTARYIFFVLPYIFILAGASFLNESKKQLILTRIVISLFLITSLFQIVFLITNPQKAFLPANEREGYLENWTSGTGIAEVANFIRSEYLKNPNQIIVVGTEGYFGTLPDGLQIYLNDLTNVKVIGVGLGLTEIPKPLEESARFGNKTYLVINDTRLNAKPEKLKMSRIASYEKAIKKDGNRENLLFFKID